MLRFFLLVFICKWNYLVLIFTNWSNMTLVLHGSLIQLNWIPVVLVQNKVDLRKYVRTCWGFLNSTFFNLWATRKVLRISSQVRKMKAKWGHESLVFKFKLSCKSFFNFVKESYQIWRLWYFHYVCLEFIYSCVFIYF